MGHELKRNIFALKNKSKTIYETTKKYYHINKILKTVLIINSLNIYSPKNGLSKTVDNKQDISLLKL